MSSNNYAEIHEEFSKTKVLWIAHTGQEIGAIMQTSAFCGPGLPGPVTYITLTEVNK